MKKRIEWIDTAKGICILLVVFNHVCIYTGLQKEIYLNYFNDFLTSFRMPLYFFLSGLFFKTYGGGLHFIKKKINKLVIPFVFFYILSGILLPLIYKHYLGGMLKGMIDISLWERITDFYYNCCQNTNGPLWFLLCLFEVNLLFCFLNILFHNKIFIYVLSTTIGIIGLLFSYNCFRLPMTLDTSFTCLPFFAFGYFIKNETHFLYQSIVDKHLLLYALLCGLFCLIVSRHIVYYKNEFYNTSFFTAHICGIIGTMMVLMIAKRLGQLPIISFYGRYSIVILCTHYPLYILLDNYILSSIATTGWTKSLIAILSILICELLIIPICIRYLPYVTAQKDLL